MNCGDIKIMIFEYLDSELNKEKEAMLFTHLSACAECRDEFKLQNLIKHEVQIHQKEVTGNFEKRVFETIKHKRKTLAQKYFTRQSPVYFNYMLGGVIIIIVLLSFLQIGSLRTDLNGFQERYENTLLQMQNQTRQWNAIINSVPAVRIEPRNANYKF